MRVVICCKSAQVRLNVDAGKGARHTVERKKVGCRKKGE
jgi:hypothetical protein